MIKVNIGTNTHRKSVVVTPETTLEQLLIDNEVNTSVGTIHIDGEPISRTQLNNTLAELGVQDNAYIISLAKADNANK